MRGIKKKGKIALSVLILYNINTYMKILHEIYKLLNDLNLTISFCESASAGALSSCFCEIKGSSKYFKGSIIAYSNAIKERVLKIDPMILEKYGSISSQTAELMAKNTNRIMKTDICVAITGNSDTNIIENKPSCLYYVAIALIDKAYVYEIQLENTERNFNRLNISISALEKLLDLLNECDKK